jgi:multidrug resistance efflux pump
MNVEFGANQMRKSYRIRAAAKGILDGREYDVSDWSFDGFRLEHAPEDLGASVGRRFPIEVRLPFASFRASFAVDAELRWVAPGVGAGFRWGDLPDELRALLRAYASAHLGGRLDEQEGLLAAQRRPEAAVPPEPHADPDTRRRLDRQLRSRAFGYGVLAVLLFLSTGFLINQRRFVYSVSASFPGSLVEVTSPARALVRRVHVAEGWAVSPGDPLVELEDLALAGQVAAAQALVEERSAAVRAAEVAAEESLGRHDVYVRAAEQRLEVARSRGEELAARLLTARKEFDRATALVAKNVTSPAELDRAREALDQASAGHASGLAEQRFAEKVLAEARAGRFFSGERVENDVHALRSDLARRKAELRQAELDLLRMQQDLERLTVRATVTGTVYSVRVREGDEVTDRKRLAQIETRPEPVVVGRFAFSDAARIKPGDEADVYFPALGIGTGARVLSVGHDALSETLHEVPVTLEMTEMPAALPPGVRAEIKVRTGISLDLVTSLDES